MISPTLAPMLTSPKARERRFHHGYVCLRCKTTQVQRWGRERTGTQRYRCFGCHRTFNDLTRTAMAGTHLPKKWQAYADTVRDGLSTRKAGARIDVDHKTAWRWRHKVMAFLAPAEQPALRGIVEADETYFRRNFKGSKPVGRRARTHGTRNGSTRGLGTDKVPVVVARARVGDTRAVVPAEDVHLGGPREGAGACSGARSHPLHRRVPGHAWGGAGAARDARGVGDLEERAELNPDRCCPNCGAMLNAA